MDRGEREVIQKRGGVKNVRQDVPIATKEVRRPFSPPLCASVQPRYGEWRMVASLHSHAPANPRDQLIACMRLKMQSNRSVIHYGARR